MPEEFDKYKRQTTAGADAFDAYKRKSATAAPEPARKPLSAGGFLKNVPISTGRMIGDVASAIVHPVRTAKGLAKIVSGNPETWKALKEMYGDRYGSYEGFLRTIYDDPAGVAADVAGLATGAGAALKGVGAIGTVGKIGAASKLTTAGKAFERVAAVADPIQTVGRVAGAIGKPAATAAGKSVRGLIGATTARGTKSFDIASELGETTIKTMRGGITDIDVLENFKGALKKSRNIRGEQYRKKLAQVKVDPTILNLDSVRKVLGTKLDDFRITIGGKGKLDFSRSPIRNASASDKAGVQAVVDDLNNWGKRSGDLTPIGVDTLKRGIDDLYTQSGEGRALVESIGDSVRGELAKVPGYSAMTKEYAEMTKLIDNINDAFSLKGKPETAITKLQNTLKQNKTQRQAMVDILEDLSGDPTLKQQLAGLSLQEVAPGGLVGKMSASVILTGIVTGYISPPAIIAIATHSPRIMGELVVAMSKMSGMAATAATSAPVRTLASPPVYRGLQVGQQAGGESAF